MGMGICDDCTKALTDECPKEKCWNNDYSEFELEVIEDGNDTK